MPYPPTSAGLDYSGGTPEEEDAPDLEENDYSGGVPEEEKVPQIVEEAYLEIERRKEACRDGYPFVVGEQGYTLHASQKAGNHKHIIYKYLLLATRLNMNDNREHADIDGSHSFLRNSPRKRPGITLVLVPRASCSAPLPGLIFKGRLMIFASE